MAITSNDIKVFQAQDNTDNDNGGGSRTSFEIVDGDVNNLFPDISRIDTVSGDVALRKVFPTVYTENNDIYYGAHAMIRKVPNDPNVSALLFYTGKPHDKRVEAQNDIEAYVVASYLEEFWLYGKHVEGARAVTLLANIESSLPDVGNTYLLKQGTNEQYVRVETIESSIVTLLYSHGTAEPTSYNRRRIICVIDQPLNFAFDGSAFHPSGQTSNTADTFATQVANAAKYYGTKTLSVEAFANDLVIQVDDIYEQLVPASKSQTPLVNKQPLNDGVTSVFSGKTITLAIAPVFGGVGGTYILPTPIVPDSLTFSVYKDDGLGNIINVSDGTLKGTVEYKTGTITTSGLSSGTTNFTYQPMATFDSIVPFTNKITITPENQGLNFSRSISPMSSMGDLFVDYRAQGKWYRISANADYTLGTDSKIGVGQLLDNNDGTNTGTVLVTLGSLPDIDSHLIITWGSGLRATNRNTETTNTVRMVANLGQTKIDHATFSMQYYSPNLRVTKTITADSEGNLSSDGGTVDGALNLHNGTIEIVSTGGESGLFEGPNTSNNVVINFETTTTDRDYLQFTRPYAAEDISAGTVTLDIGEPALRETVSLYLPLKHEIGNGGRRDTILRFHADGTLNANTSSRAWGVTASLTAAGVLTLTLPTKTGHMLNPAWEGSFGSNNRYIDVSEKWQIHDNIKPSVQYRTNTTTYGIPYNITDKIENVFSYEVQLVDSLVGEVALGLLDSSPDSDKILVSRNGSVFQGFKDGSTGTNVGTIDYATGLMTLSYYSQPIFFNVIPYILMTDELGEEKDTLSNVTFRTAATKLTTSSFQMSYKDINGNMYTLTSDGNGNVSGSLVDVGASFVDSATGMANIVFTTDNIVADSIRYTAIAESSLPLDPELLGLNPVRLPPDGRVPVFDKGRHLVIFHENTTAIGTPTADQVVNVGRTEQSYMEVVDVNGKRLDPVQYVADRALGTITFANPLTLVDKYNEPLTAPFSAVDRIEDMLLATDVQINGQITLSAGLSRDYPANDTKVASALVWGDVGSRVWTDEGGPFSQEIWDNGNPVWSDQRVGDPTSAQYDDVNSPIAIDNKSSASGRWAIVFRSSTTVDVIEENLGVVETGISITVDDVAPVNPATGAPYFTMYKEGFGGGWVTNNVIRLNTDSGDENMWVIRTVKAGALSELTDSIELETRGDAN
jgi:hypothetical protein